MLETDASGLGLRVVLAQEQDSGYIAPIAFASRTLQKHEQAYGVPELEALGVELYGQSNTSAHICMVIPAMCIPTMRPSRHCSILHTCLESWQDGEELDLKMHYCPVRSNKVADALSRQQLVPSVTSGDSTARALSPTKGTVNQLVTTADYQLQQR